MRTRFQYADGHLFFSEACLHTDRIEFTGWRFSGRHRRVVLFDQIIRVDWVPERTDGVNLLLHLRDEETLHLRIKGAGLWKYEIEGLARTPAAVPQPLTRTSGSLRRAS